MVLAGAPCVVCICFEGTQDSWHKEWYLQFALAMAAPSGTTFGQRRPTFFAVVCSGVHTDADEVFTKLSLQDLSDEAPPQFWQALWEAFSARTAAASSADP